MLVGHYAAAFVLKSRSKAVSLGWLFVGVQFADLLFLPLVLVGIERMRIVENFTPSTHFELVYMPYSHSLVASFVWAGAVYAAFRLLPLVAKQDRSGVALVMALATVSHWFFDLPMHVHDLPLLGDGSLKVGFGLWNYPVVTFLLEAALLVGGLILYLRSTKGEGFGARYGIVIFVAVLLLVNAGNIFGPLTTTEPLALALPALAAYGVFAGVAFWLDRKRA